MTVISLRLSNKRSRTVSKSWVPRLETFFIPRVLDAGAEGIMVPMTSTKEDAEAIARFSKFMPIGQRGFGSNCGMTDFTPQKAPTFMKESNDHTLIVA